MEFYNFKIIQNFKGTTPNFAHAILPLEKKSMKSETLNLFIKSSVYSLSYIYVTQLQIQCPFLYITQALLLWIILVKKMQIN